MQLRSIYLREMFSLNENRIEACRCTEMPFAHSYIAYDKILTKRKSVVTGGTND